MDRSQLIEICTTASNEPNGSLSTPLYRSTAYRFTSERLQNYLQGNNRDTWLYSRYSSPTVRALENKLAALENAEDAVVCSSGMAAISSALFYFYRPSCRWFISRDLYGVTYSLLQNDFARMGVQLEWFDATDVRSLYDLASAGAPNLIYFETISNPLVRVADLPAIMDFAHSVNAITIVDNTFASPWNCCPVEYGADVVIESGSKYLNGHSDVICGVATGKRSVIDDIWKQMTRLGGNLSPDAASLWDRGLKTFPLRMQQSCETAKLISHWLSTHIDIEQVFYPGFTSHLPKWLQSGSGLLAFRVKGGNPRAESLLQHLSYIVPATSLGGVESLLSLPHQTSHIQFTETERESLGILSGTVRLSIGLETFFTIQNDLQQALNTTRD